MRIVGLKCQFLNYTMVKGFQFAADLIVIIFDGMRVEDLPSAGIAFIGYFAMKYLLRIEIESCLDVYMQQVGIAGYIHKMQNWK